MPSSIEFTVSTAMREKGLSSYIGHVDDIVARLVDRERNITDQLLDYASDADLNVDEVRDYLKQSGMAVREANPFEGGQTAEAESVTLLRNMARQIEALTQFARENGFSG